MTARGSSPLPELKTTAEVMSGLRTNPKPTSPPAGNGRSHQAPTPDGELAGGKLFLVPEPSGALALALRL